ncbi:hypothetical protein CVT24_007725 [Panaeolus cyanescens]|uniref:Uncharacterized protein n=1 Tax=Panaeolus cyanescens TaxID=181874 RepID=A0A409VRD1_9AGAR|nr:hypothetical protein CVT24_007725 [Panaeolus cyanescens]
MSLNRKLTAQSHDPNVVKNVERQIIREAKNEETAIKHALKDLSKTEKEEGKAYKHALKAKSAAEKSAKHEQTTLKKMHKAQHSHDVAATNLHRANNDYQMYSQNHERLVDEINSKKQEIENCMRVNDERTRQRNKKLAALHATNSDGEDESHLGLPSSAIPAQPNGTQDIA